jgi:LemA protein
MGISGYAVLALVAVLSGWLILGYNAFVRAVNRTKEAWADIDVQLKRRYDLIPNLVETVKGYTTHEREAFENVTRARAAAMGAQTVEEHARAENLLTGALKSIFALAEAYPDLKASQNFAKLQDELADTENKIQAARRFYNGNVRDLNTMIESFPSNLIARGFGFQRQVFFELEAASPAKDTVAVNF